MQAMENMVEEVVLYDTELDMEALTEYNGQGECRRVTLCLNTMDRYREELKSWAESRNWRIAKDEYGVLDIINNNKLSPEDFFPTMTFKSIDF